MIYPLMSVDLARKLFLLVLSDQGKTLGPHVARSYLREKVQMLWACQAAFEVYGRLDLERQRVFDTFAEAEGFYKTRSRAEEVAAAKLADLIMECGNAPAEGSGLDDFAPLDVEFPSLPGKEDNFGYGQ